MTMLSVVDSLTYGTNLTAAPTDDAEALRVQEERQARTAWSKRFELARATIPPKFSWIRASATSNWQTWRERLPWITAEHIGRLRGLWRERTNLLICGPPDIGKTCLMVFHAATTLADAYYDAPIVRDTRAALRAWERMPAHRRCEREQLSEPCEFVDDDVVCVAEAHREKHFYVRREKPPQPPDPAWLAQVKEAQGLRFVSAPSLLDERQQGPNEQRLSEALRASALYIDEVGREMYGARGEGHLASGRRAVMMRVLESRWANERRFVATTEHTIEQLADMYGVGSFRRIAGERSGATVIDLGEDQWAGAWLRQQKAKTSGRDR